MSVTPNNIIIYGATDMAIAAGGNVGGAVSLSTRVAFSDFSASGTAQYVSDSASDTSVTVSLYGRNASGTIVFEGPVTLNGTTQVASSSPITFQRALQGVVSGTTAVGNVAALFGTAVASALTAQGGANASGTTAPYIQVASGTSANYAINQVVIVGTLINRIIAIDTANDYCYVAYNWSSVPTSSSTYSIYNGMVFELAPNQVKTIIRPFYNCQANASGGATVTEYAKVFAVNTNTTTDLTAPSGQSGVEFQLITTALSSGAYMNIGIESTLDDTLTTTRETAPSGITFTTNTTTDTTVTAYSSVSLTHGNAAADAQGLWIELTLPAGVAPYDGSFDITINGSTT